MHGRRSLMLAQEERWWRTAGGASGRDTVARKAKPIISEAAFTRNIANKLSANQQLIAPPLRSKRNYRQASMGISSPWLKGPSDPQSAALPAELRRLSSSI
ncbi:hypothetical protein BDN71DRAFT_1514240 [Pleurotus eryngii]|uniref:Uncharacterized protein n=1 Tax=Pleurotus eryngii TaxID=5323 RepID=A0A9P5ZIC9_PLEER|nr:hypothetical protein BDN71DRAFT_1514240 [Pleurotus eryngii]